MIPRRSFATWLAVPLLLGACTAGPPAASTPAGPAPVVLEAGGASDSAEEAAAALVEAASAALAAGRADEARSNASRVVSEYPRTRVSGRALGIVARATAAQSDWPAALEAAARLERLLPPGDDRAGEMLIIQARALRGLDRPEDALTRLLSAPADAVDEASLALARDLSGQLSRDALGRALAATPPGQPLAAPAMVAYARTLLLAGDGAGAERYARAALEAGAVGEDAESARSVLEGRVPGGAATPARLGALLPLTGSPALRTFAEGVSEGIEAARTAAGLDEIVQIEVLDPGGEPESSAALVGSAEGQGVLGLVGPLLESTFASAAAARRTPIPLISPTAAQVPAGASGVYSLGGVDPGAPQALARWAASAGIRQTVVLHAASGPSAEEARIFAEAFQTLGGSVLRTLTYEPGGTFFREQISIVQGLRPEALVLPVPAEDLVALAPQVTFYGLDTLGVRVLGTAGWTDEMVLSEVSTRHLDGVVAASASPPGGETAGYRRFVEAYETRYQRSLVEPRLAALGYDAASLLMLAVRAGARTPEATARALEDIEGFEGATGTLSVVDGRIVRDHYMVCLWEGALRPIADGEIPVQRYRPYPPDPDTTIVREGPGRPAGYRCPDVPAPDSVGGSP